MLVKRNCRIMSSPEEKILWIFLMTLVSFVRGAYETRKPRASTRGWNSFSDKNSFRYTNKWLPTAYFIERSFSMSKDDKSLSHTRWNCKYHIVFPKNIEEKQSMGN